MSNEQIDLITARLVQVSGVLGAVLAADDGDGIAFHPCALSASLWAAQTLLDQAIDAAEALGGEG